MGWWAIPIMYAIFILEFKQLYSYKYQIQLGTPYAEFNLAT